MSAPTVTLACDSCARATHKWVQNTQVHDFIVEAGRATLDAQPYGLDNVPEQLRTVSWRRSNPPHFQAFFYCDTCGARWTHQLGEVTMIGGCRFGDTPIQCARCKSKNMPLILFGVV